MLSKSRCELRKLALALLAAPALLAAQEGPPPPAIIAIEAPAASAPAESSSGPAESNGGPAESMENIGTTVAGDAIIKYDPETGSIIVITDEATNNQISHVIETLDKPIPQVLIKVLFLEVTYNNDSDLGVQAALQYGSVGEKDTLGSDFGLATGAQGALYNVVKDDFTATLRALATAGKLEVLSRPSVLARNNETATITIGQEVPFIRNSRVTDNGQTINTIEYEDIGIILEVTPHITPERVVEMEVSPEISTLTGETIPISDTANAQVIAKRSAETRVSVADGKTVVIGGLMEDNKTDTIRKIPLLGDIPVLGVLFRRTIKSKSKTELLIFLTPHVVLSSDDLQDMSHNEHQKTELEPKAFKDVKLDKYLDESSMRNPEP